MSEVFGKFRKTAKSTIQILGVSSIDYEAFLRGVHNAGIKCSLTVCADGSCTVYISAYETSLSMERAQQAVSSKLSAVENLLSGVKYRTAENDINFNQRHFSALIQVVGVPRVSQFQLSGFVNAVVQAKIPAMICVNINPALLRYDPVEDYYLSRQSKNAIANNLSKTSLERNMRMLNESCFSAAFSVFTNAHSEENLRRNMESVLSFLGSFYNSENSKIKTTILRGNKAKKNLEKLLRGEQLYSTVLTAKELSAYFQIPLTYSIELLQVARFATPRQIQGIEIGIVLDGNMELFPACLNPENIFEHTAVWGATGVGKTTAIKNIVIGLHNQGIKATIFDWHDEYREIASKLNGELGKDVLIINPFLTNFSINPLELPNIQGTERDVIVSERTENFISLMKQIFILGEIQESRVRKALYRVYENNNSPTISDLIRELSSEKVDNLVSKLAKFTEGFYGEIFNKKQSTLPFGDIEKATTIFELARLPSELRAFFVCVFLILWWDWKRKSGSLPHVSVLDEFQHCSGFSVVWKMLSEARKYKEGLICSHQGPDQLSDRSLLENLVRNTATKIIFRLEQSTDKQIVSAALGGLEKDQIGYLSSLETGEAIVKTKETKQPFRIKTRNLERLEKISDERVKEAFVTIAKYPEAGTERVHIISLNELEKRFLVAIHGDPKASTAQITKLLKIRTSKGTELRESLKSKGFLVEDKVRIGAGRPREALKLTEKALRMLGLEARNLPENYGSQEHIETVGKIAETLRGKGWNVEIEKDFCDLKAEKGRNKIAIEVETGKGKSWNQLIQNVKRDLDWANKVVIVCPNEEIGQKIQEVIEKEGFEKVCVISYSKIGTLESFLS
jgi:hypothetical protein